MLRDPEFGPIRLRAFGTYALKAIDAKALLTELVGTDGVVETDEVTELMRSIITEAFSDMLGEKQIAALDLASHYREFSDDLRKYVCAKIDDEYGLDVPQLFIVNISLPEAVEKMIDTRTSMGVVGDMGKFQQFQFGQAMTQAAQNPAGGGGEGLGLGLGLAMAGRMLNTPGVFGGAPAGAPPAPPPLPGAAWHVAVNGQTMGPFAPEQLRSGVGTGELTAATLVWAPHLAGWTAAGSVAELAPLFAKPAAPPPPPPA
jgi:membrane protease subunit (stomatin/prohibitin family)